MGPSETLAELPDRTGRHRAPGWRSDPFLAFTAGLITASACWFAALTLVFVVF